MKEALLYDKLEKNTAQCHVCNHHCTILASHRGICGVRENHDGRLDLLVYEKAISESVDPIEKKPFYHFLPGSQSLSIATVGCNFRCGNCQNWQISQATKQSGYTDLPIQGEMLTAQKVIQDARQTNCRSIAYTYTEPTIWMEYALDCMKLAHQNNIKNVWVSNGYMSEQTRQLILPYLDAINIDLKFFDNQSYQKYCGGQLDPILDNAKFFKKNGVWLELTTLVIPTLSDQTSLFKKIIQFVKKELGPETPWHISAFSPEISYKMKKFPPTDVQTLQKAHDLAKQNGLHYVYTGNAPGLDSEHTYCPHCHEKAIERIGFAIKRHDTQGKCPHCQTRLDIII